MSDDHSQILPLFQTGPQLENGYTKIANELLEAIIRSDFSKRQIKVLLFILRKTYGFNKKTDDMTIQQIANGTDLHRPHASNALAELVAKKAVLKRDGKFGYVLGINKNYTEWAPVPKRYAYQNGTPPVPKRYGPRTKTVHTKETPQKTTPKERLVDRFDRFWQAYPKKVGKGAARNSFRKVNPDDEMMTKILNAIANQKRSRQWLDGFVPNPSTWLNQERWDDEIETPRQANETDRGRYKPL